MLVALLFAFLDDTILGEGSFDNGIEDGVFTKATSAGDQATRRKQTMWIFQNRCIVLHGLVVF